MNENMHQMDWKTWRQESVDWISGQKLPGKPGQYRFTSKSSSPVLFASCYAAFGLELMDGLSGIAPVERSAWAGEISRHQDPDSGLFLDRLFRPSDFPDTGHDWNYITWQMTFFCVHALDALQERPHFPLHFVEHFLRTQNLQEWLRKLDWSNPWLISNEIMFLLSFLLMDKDSEDKQRKLAEVFDWLDVHQNPDTGYWDLGRPVTPLNAMAGAFHFYFFYFFAGRRVNFPERIIEQTLALQQKDGLFSPHGGGGSCHDLDAVDILVKFGLFCQHKQIEVKEALTRTFDAILANRKGDGSFCEARRDLPPKSWKRRIAERLCLDTLLNKPWSLHTVRHSGWKEIEYRIDEGDLFASWFRPLALALISSRYPQDFNTGIEWRFRRTPGLGWHDPAVVVASQR